MKITPIKDAVSEEHVLDVRPAFALYPQTTWKRRLNHYSGRSLTHTALTKEQLWLNGELAGLGRVVSSGIMQGLNLTAKLQTENENTSTKIFVQAGRGLTISGETVSINRDTSCNLNDVFVYQHELLQVEMASEGDASFGPALGLPTLQDLRDAALDIPRVGIIVLEALYAEISESPDEDICGEDVSNYAFENWQLQDACRLVLYTWPENWIPLPAEDAAWRNRLAAAIFDKERLLDNLDYHPWEKLGVPLALVALDEDYNIRFTDRHAVIRQGGRFNIDNNGLEDGGNPLLWQSRFEQFNAQLADRILALGKIEELAKQSSQAFRYLPPVGVLPKPFANPRANSQDFFPVNVEVKARVIPFEQLDIAVRESQPLLPIDINAFDEVELLVPVSQNHFDPKLLKVEQLDPAFDESIRQFTQVRDTWFGRREHIRQKLSALFKALDGKPIEFGSDPDRLDSLELAAPQQKASIELGMPWKVLKGTAAPPNNWMTANFNDSVLPSLQSSLGYGRAPWDTELSDMRGAYTSLFLRRSFLLHDTDLQNRFVLRINTNAGFIVYLNGQEIHRFNLATSVGPTNHRATSDRKMITREFEYIFDENAEALLQTGLNTLALQVHTPSVSETNFLFSPRLIQHLSLSNYLLAEVDEDDFGVSLSAESSENSGDIYSPVFEVDHIVNLLAEISTESSPLSSSEQDKLVAEGIKEFIHFLESKVNLANDKVDFSFVKLQTEIYRIRQYVLGSSESTKLATSPILASIAKGESAAATRQEITSFVDGLKAARTSVAASAIPSSASSVSSTESGISATPTLSLSKSLTPSVTSDLRFVTGAFTVESSARTTLPKTVSDSLSASLSKDVVSINLGTQVLDRSDAVFVAAAESGIKTLSLGSTKEISSLFGSSSATKIDIVEQSAIVGATSQYRNVTVSERLQEPLATNTRTTGVATKAESIQGFLDIGINVADISVPGFRDDTGKEEAFTFADIKSNNLIAEILANKHDQNEKDGDDNELGDESAYFNSGVRALENSAVVLRKIEGRIYAYNKIIRRCKEVQANIEADVKLVDARLAEIAELLAESRHDLSVARILRQEAAEEVKSINAVRDNIIQKYVPYFIFRRPRFSYTWSSMPARPIVPMYENTIVQLCLDAGEEVPEELVAIVDLVRNAPLRWLKIADEILAKINKQSNQNEMIEKIAAKPTAAIKRNKRFQSLPDKVDLRAMMMMGAYEASLNTVARSLGKIKNAEINGILRSSWTETKTKLKQFANLDDVLNGGSSSGAAAKIAAEELSNIRKVVGCLYKRFGEISPAIKLNWIEKLSQFDDSIPLSNLYNLPRWNEVDGTLRKDMQKLNTWLYGRFEEMHSETATFVNNLVRMCLLLASSSPVTKILAGALPEQTTVTKGGDITVAVNTKEVFVGMEVSIQGVGKSLARGRVKDIRDGNAIAEILHAEKQTTELPANTRIHFNNKKFTGGSANKSNSTVKRNDVSSAAAAKSPPIISNIGKAKAQKQTQTIKLLR